MKNWGDIHINHALYYIFKHIKTEEEAKNINHFIKNV